MGFEIYLKKIKNFKIYRFPTFFKKIHRNSLGQFIFYMAIFLINILVLMINFNMEFFIGIRTKTIST